MNENYLHLIWEMKRLPSSEMLSVKGERIKVLSFGLKNDQLAGPDFFYGKVKYDGLVHCGMIEIHVKSSDWYAHGHQKDPRYDNVVLHVVYEYDRVVIQNGREIPTVEIRDHIDFVHFSKYRKGQLKTTKVLCQTQLNTLPEIYLESMKAKALVQKLSDKVERVIQLAGKTREEVFYGLLNLAFGTGTNRIGFERILSRAPLKDMFVKGSFQKEIFLQSAQAALDDYEKSAEWHFKGARPQGNPKKRINELASVLNSIDIGNLLEEENTERIRDRIIYHLKFLTVSRFMRDQITVNVIVPYLWFLGIELVNDQLKEEALNILEQTRAEDNYITRYWKKHGVSLYSAYDSQALMALFRYHCSHKNCLSCDVGTKLLKR